MICKCGDTISSEVGSQIARQMGYCDQCAGEYLLESKVALLHCVELYENKQYTGDDLAEIITLIAGV